MTLHFGKGGNAIGTLALTIARNQGREKAIDDYRVTPDAMALTAQSSNRLLYALPAFRDTVHLSGTSISLPVVGGANALRSASPTTN